MRFGIGSEPDEFNGREVTIIVNALNNQRLYFTRLAERNRDEEAKGRNLVNALEIQVLIEKVEMISESRPSAEAALREIRGWAEASCIHNPDEADLEILRIVQEFFKEES